MTAAGPEALEALLADASVNSEVFDLRPDNVALLVAADGLPGGPSDELADAWLREAETAAVARLGGGRPRGAEASARAPDASALAFARHRSRTRRVFRSTSAVATDSTLAAAPM